MFCNFSGSYHFVEHGTYQMDVSLESGRLKCDISGQSQPIFYYLRMFMDFSC